MTLLKSKYKKDRGIALIFSLFFLIILFAIGVTLLFRAQLSNKTATALAHSDLDKLRAKGAIGIVQNTISHAMKDKTSPSFDGGFGLNLGGDATDLRDEYTLRSSSLKSGTSALYSYNNGGANLSGRWTNATFSLAHDGINIGLGGSGEVGYNEWLVYNNEGDLINQSTGDTVFNESIENGESGLRLSFVIIDQTGKINPNAASVADDNSAGLDYEVFNNSTTAPFALDAIFSGGDASASVYANSTFQNIQDLYTFNETLNSTDKAIAHKSLYPYSKDLVYEEESKFIEGTTERLNLERVRLVPGETSTDSSGATVNSLFDPTDTADQKVQKLIDAIPYLAQITRTINKEITEETVTISSIPETDPSAPYSLKKTVDTSSPATVTSENLKLNTKIAANIIDYIDQDISATTNFIIDENQVNNNAGQAVNVIPDMTPDIYCGYEGITIQSIGFYSFEDNGRWLGSYGKRTMLSPFVHVSVDADLDGIQLKDTILSGDNANNATLRCYVAYEANYFAWNQTTGTVVNGGQRITNDCAYVIDINTAYPNIATSFENSPIGPNGFVGSPQQRGNYYNYYMLFTDYKYGWSSTNDERLHNHSSSPNFASLSDSEMKEIYSPLLDVSDGTVISPTEDLNHDIVTFDIQLRFTKPIILFIDLDDDKQPDNGEIVDLAQLPHESKGELNEGGSTWRLRGSGAQGQEQVKALAIDGYIPNSGTALNADQQILLFHQIGDPRNNTHKHNWKQYEAQNPVTMALEPSWYPVPPNSPAALWGISTLPYVTNTYDNQDISSTTSFLSADYLSFEFKDGVDQELVYEDGVYRAIKDPLEVSTMTVPFDAKTKKFGGIKSLSELGRIFRGEDWKTLNIAQYQPPVSATGTSNTYRDYNNYSSYNESYIGKLDDDLSTVLTASDFSGGDGRIFDEVYIDNGDFNSRAKKTIVGAFNPNTTKIEGYKALFSGLKTPYKYTPGGLTDWNFVMNYDGSTALAPTQIDNVTKAHRVTNFGNNDNSSSVDSLKLDPFLTELESQLQAAQSAKVAPFDRKYTYSHDLSTSNDFNAKDVRRLVSMRLGNLFANSNINNQLTDVERENLYFIARNFMSIRYNYFSAIMLIEPFKFVPTSTPLNSSSNPTGVVNLSSKHRAKVTSHYRVRAELVQDIYTNEIEVLNYQILN